MSRGRPWLHWAAATLAAVALTGCMPIQRISGTADGPPPTAEAGTPTTTAAPATGGSTAGTAPVRTSGGSGSATTTDGSTPSRGTATPGGGTAAPPGSATMIPMPESVPPIEWTRQSGSVDTATVVVPADYADPDGDTIEIRVARHRATDQENRIGSLLINYGGPGFGSADSVASAPLQFDGALIQHFDIVGWDPRGTGRSTPAIDCIDDFDPYAAELDTTPDTEADREKVIAMAKQFADGCVERSGELVEVVGTNNSARDMEMIRRALGEEKISYFGFSYGSELGAVWATLFPDTVRAAVFDGAADPTADDHESSVQQLTGFSDVLTTFLARCSGDDGCAFHNDGDAEGAFDALMEQLDAEPIPSVEGRPPVNRDVALSGVSQAMYVEELWPVLELALAEAQDGDGSGLLALHDDYYRRLPDGTYGNQLEAFQVISCADTALRQTVAETDAMSAWLTAVAPRFVPPGSIGYFCNFFPPARDPRIDVTGAGAGPIVVVGTTGDAATPLESSRKMAQALEDGRFVIVEANQHTGYGANRCIVALVNDYLVDLEPPAPDTECT